MNINDLDQLVAARDEYRAAIENYRLMCHVWSVTLYFDGFPSREIKSEKSKLLEAVKGILVSMATARLCDAVEALRVLGCTVPEDQLTHDMQEAAS